MNVDFASGKMKIAFKKKKLKLFLRIVSWLTLFVLILKALGWLKEAYTGVRKTHNLKIAKSNPVGWTLWAYLRISWLFIIMFLSSLILAVVLSYWLVLIAILMSLF